MSTNFEELFSGANDLFLKILIHYILLYVCNGFLNLISVFAIFQINYSVEFT